MGTYFSIKSLKLPKG